MLAETVATRWPDKLVQTNQDVKTSDGTDVPGEVRADVGAGACTPSGDSARTPGT